MPTLPIDYELKADQLDDPILWIVTISESARSLIDEIDLSDAAMERYLGGGGSMKLKSFGHDSDGIHFLLTRKGTAVHTDPAYARYSHQLVLRNDGNRLRGLPRLDHGPDHYPMLVPGTMYCLDTHSPHQGTEDPRFTKRPGQAGCGMKAVIAIDRNEALDPGDVWPLFKPWLGRDFHEVGFDPKMHAAPKWKDRT
jgi:hypothetical protein